MLSFAVLIAPTWTPRLLQLQRALTTHLSRDEQVSRKTAQDAHLFLTYCDGEEFGDSPWLETESGWVLCAGHPLWRANRQCDLERAMQSPNLDKDLSSAQGTFTLLKYDKHKHELSCYCDSLAIRPYYVLSLGAATLVVSHLRILTELPIILSNDEEGIVQKALLGYALGDSTRFREVKAAQPGEKRLITPDSQRIFRYFSWADHDFSPSSEGDVFSDYDAAFSQVVKRYAKSDTQVISTLSGGLDSRLIAWALQQAGVSPHCWNFSQGQSLDLVFAQQFAQRQDIDLYALLVEDTQAQSVERRLWSALQETNVPYFERPQLAWSGNGGSVCMGGVYHTNAIFEACQSGSVTQVVECFLQSQMAYISSRLVKNAKQWQRLLRERLHHELNQYQYLPLAKRFQLFLWENDQHRHCADAAEEADLFKLDFCYPFYAQSLLGLLWRMPIASVRNHGFYMAWLRQCAPETISTPWQAYPEHEPCPLTTSVDLTHSQWQLTRPKRHQQQLINTGWRLYQQKCPRYRHWALALQCCLTQWGWRDYSSNLNLISKIEAQWRDQKSP